MTSLLGLLSGRQKFFVDKISQPLIRESSNFEVTSSDEELDKQFNDPFYNTPGIVESKNLVDRRLVDVFRIKRIRDVILTKD